MSELSQTKKEEEKHGPIMSSEEEEPTKESNGKDSEQVLHVASLEDPPIVCLKPESMKKLKDILTRNNENSSSGCNSSSTSFSGVDIFRPILTNVERKILGINDIGTIPFPSSCLPDKNVFIRTSLNTVSNLKSNISLPTLPAIGGGGGDADEKMFEKSLEILPLPILNETREVTKNAEVTGKRVKIIPKPEDRKSSPLTDLTVNKGQIKCGKQKKLKKVSFKFREDNSREEYKPNCGSESEVSAENQLVLASASQNSLNEVDNTAHSKDTISPETDTFSRFVESLSTRSLKSKKLESKLQQEIRVAFFDLEAERASEDWKFRKKVEALQLDYQKKLFDLVENHNDFQKKLQGRFLKQIHKTEKRLKKEALQGKLKEGNCLNVSTSISNFKIRSINI